MPERITTGVQRLFEVRVLHHYWLDDGKTVFDQLPPEAQYGRLATYDMRRFLDVRPTDATERLLRGLGCIFVKSPTGFVVGCPRGAVLPSDAVFKFMLTVKDGGLFNYTALTLMSRKVYDIYYGPENTAYRYKENVPLLSNLSGATRDIPPGNKLLFLSREIPPLASTDKIEAIVKSGSALEQLISDDHSVAPQQLDADAGKLPVYLNQGDIPDIVPPAGLTGAPPQGIRLEDGITEDVFGLISIAATAPDSAFSFVDGAGKAKTPYPVYQVRIKNRSSYWTYLDKATGAVKTTESVPLPLTCFGNAGTKQKPSVGLVKPEVSGTAVMKLVSEIYV